MRIDISRKISKRSVFGMSVLLSALLVSAGCGRAETAAQGEAMQEEAVQEETTQGEAVQEETVQEEAVQEYVSFGSQEWNILQEARKDWRVNAASGEETEETGMALFADLSVEDAEYVLYVPEGMAELTFYDAGGKYLDGSRIEAPEGIFLELPDGCAYMSCALPLAVAAQSFLVREDADAQKPLYIVSKEHGDKIQDAVDGIDWEGTVILLPGIYQEQVKAWGKKVHLYGADKEGCVLESYSASYYSPPLEIAAGSVRNLTIRARDVDGRTSDKYAYGVHVEDNALYGETLVFENCDIRSDYNSAVGLGMRGGCEVQFINVTLTGKEWGLFCHDCAGVSYSGYQKLSLTDCVVEGLTGNEALCLDSQGINGAVVEVAFVNTVLKNENAVDETSLLVTRNQGGAGETGDWRGLKNYVLSEESTGNNIADMNFDTSQ